MRIALKCKKCRTTYMQQEDDICLEIDFYNEQLIYVCPACKHENRMDIANWKKKQEHSALPRMRLTGL